MPVKKVLFIALVLVLVQQSVFAQPGNPSPGPVGGVIYLLLSALGLGVFSLRKNKKQ